MRPYSVKLESVNADGVSGRLRYDWSDIPLLLGKVVSVELVGWPGFWGLTGY